MKVVGVTTQQEVTVVSPNRKFNMGEILVVMDEEMGRNVLVEVLETMSFNEYIPETSMKNKFIDDDVLSMLSTMGFDVKDSAVHLAKTRTLSELIKPMTTGSNVRLPQFEEIHHLLVRDVNGWNLGVIRGTDEVAETMPENLKRLGVLMDENKKLIPYQSVPFLFDYKSMYEYPHIGVFGGSGSGKSYTQRVLHEEIMKIRFPALSFDIHFENEFNRNTEDMPESFRKDFSSRHLVLTIGKDIGIEFPEVSTMELIKMLSSTSGGLTENMENTIRATHKKNDTYNSYAHRLKMLNEALEKKGILEKMNPTPNPEIPEQKRDAELLDLVRKFSDKVNIGGIKGVQWRLHSLKHHNLFDGTSSKVVEALAARKMVVIRGGVESMKIYSSYIVNKVYQMRRKYRDAMAQGDGSVPFAPPFMLLFDEGHNFAPQNGDSPVKSVLREIAQEGRKYGAFLTFGSQRPALIDNTIMAQLSTKIIHRTVRGQDIQALSEETDLTAENGRRLPYLPSGETFISSAVVGRTVAVRIRGALTKSPNSINPFDELEMTSRPKALTDAIVNALPISPVMVSQLQKSLSAEGMSYSVSELLDVLNEMVDDGTIAAEKGAFGDKYVQKY